MASPQPENRPDVSIIIVNYNTRDDTIACVSSVLAHRDDLDVQIVVVDNGSVDGSVEALREAHPGIDVIDAGRNLGFARGVNRGVAASRAASSCCCSTRTRS